MGVLKSLARKMGVGAARLAKKGVTGALDAASDALERAVFGQAQDQREEERDAAPGESSDPFAKLKEKERKESGKVR